MKSIGKVKAVLEGSSEEILSMVDQIRAGDKKSESTASKGCWTMGGAVLFGAAILVIGMNFPALDSDLLNLLLLAPVVAFVGGAIATTVGQTGNVEDSRYESLERLHRFLEKDCDRNCVYRYELDLRPLNHRGFYTHKEKFGGLFSLPRGTHSYFTAPVVSADLKLRDGTRLQVELAKVTRQTSRTKRGASGKVKTKTKYKYKDQYSCRVKLPQGAPEVPTESLRVTDQELFPMGGPKYKATGHKVSATLVRKLNDEKVDAEPLLRMLVFVFRKIQEGRRGIAA